MESTHITGVSSEAYHRVETLTLGGVVMENSGVYTCVATNRGGDDSASAELQVIGLCLLYHSFSHACTSYHVSVQQECTALDDSQSVFSAQSLHRL